MGMRNTLQLRGRKGFTLVELAVVIIIIGVLAAFAVPRFLDSVERSKAAEAFNYQAAVRAAQERYQVRQGTYTNDLTKLDIQMPDPKYFSVGTPAEGAVGPADRGSARARVHARAVAGCAGAGDRGQRRPAQSAQVADAGDRSAGKPHLLRRPSRRRRPHRDGRIAAGGKPVLQLDS